MYQAKSRKFAGHASSQPIKTITCIHRPQNLAAAVWLTPYGQVDEPDLPTFSGMGSITSCCDHTRIGLAACLGHALPTPAHAWLERGRCIVDQGLLNRDGETLGNSGEVHCAS